MVLKSLLQFVLLIKNLSKPFKIFFNIFLTRGVLLLVFLFFSCEPFKKNKTNTLVKLGEQKWTLEDILSYMELRWNHSKRELVSQKDEQEFKEMILKEVLFQSLLEEWVKNEKIHLKNQALSRESFILFFTDPSKLKALRKYQKLTLLKTSLQDHLRKNIPEPKLQTQKQFYQKNKALFRKPAKCQLEQIVVENKKLAHSLIERLKQGESFSALAKNHSLQKSPGWVYRGQLPIFDQVCFKNQASLSTALKSDYGYHIFLKKNFKTAQQKSFKASQEKIISLLKDQELPRLFQKWLKEETLKKSVWIDRKSLEEIKIQYKRKSE